MEIGKKVQVNKRMKELLQKNIQFNVGKIQKNQIGISQQLYSDGDYIFEESLQNKSLASVDKNIYDKQSTPKKSDKGILAKHTEQEAKSLMNQLAYPIHIKNKMKSLQEQNKQNKPIENDKDKDIQIEQIHEDDLTELWQKIQMEHKSNYNNGEQSALTEIKQQKKQQHQQKEINQENSKIVQKNSQNLIRENSQSQCQLTEQQLKIWMQNCQQTETPKQRHSHRSNCIYQTEQDQRSKLPDKKQNEQNQQDLGQWDQIAQFLQKQDQQVKEIYKNEGLVCLANMTEQKHEEEFLIIDTPNKLNSQQQKKVKQIQKTNYHKNTSKFGPWVFNLKHYELYKKYKIKLIQELNLKIQLDKQLTGQQINLIYNESRSLRKINWEISEERNPQIKMLRSKRYCKMNLIQYGRDFLIFDHFKFATEPVREGSHIYMGVRSYGDFQQIQCKQISQKSLSQNEKNMKQIKQYMYFPGNGECLLQTAYKNLDSQMQTNIKSFDILLSLTMQRVAVCQRIMIEEEKDKRERILVKMYDNYQKSVQNYLGIVQSKISNFSDQWYCDTIIYIPKKKEYNMKNFHKEWQKFRIQLRLSEVGTIVAELGIFDASSSVTNCILFGQSKYNQFMMGTISQNQKQINYITRIAGLSPVMAFATILSRKIFVMSS